MNNKEHFAEVQAQIVSLMKEYGTNWTQPWVQNGMPRKIANLDERYQGINILILALQNYECREWGTFAAWQSKGYKIRAKEKSTRVFFWKQKKKNPKWLEGEELASYQKTGELPIYWLCKPFPVFNGQQIEGYDYERFHGAPELLATEERRATANEFVEAQSAVFVPSSVPCYWPKKDVIGMPAFNSFHTDLDYLSTKMHELSHWTGHETRLNRPMEGSFGTESYAKEELVAEISSAYLCNYLGLTKEVRKDHAMYLNSWIQLILDDASAMVTAFSQAYSVFEFLEGNYIGKKTKSGRRDDCHVAAG